MERVSPHVAKNDKDHYSAKPFIFYGEKFDC